MDNEFKRAKEVLNELGESYVSESYTVCCCYPSEISTIESALNQAEKEHEELAELKEFVKIIGPDFYTECRGQVLIINGNSFPVNKEQIDFLMKVARKYAKKED